MAASVTTSDAWWELHLRNARGELLSPDERKVYEAHLARLEASEVLADDLEPWRQKRDEIKKLEEECTQLQSRRKALSKQIAQLDALLGARQSGAAVGS